MKREGSFEVMRTVAMFFIVVYHCLTHGVGGKYAFDLHHSPSLFNFVYSDFLLVFCSISVNLYVMVSGYFLSASQFKLSRILRIWVNACFYSCVIVLLFMSLSLTPWSVVSLGKSFFPLSTDAYWFVTQFVGLLILSPFLALLVRQMSYRQYVVLLISGAFICLSIIPDFPLGKRFHVAHGNSVWSFAYLFMIAGFIRHHVCQISKCKLLASVVTLSLLVMVCEIFYGIHGNIAYLYWFNYNGTPFLLSITVFLLIRQIHIPETGIWKVLINIAPYTFGVYLIHDHLLMREWLWKSISLSLYCDQWTFPLIVLGLCGVIFAISAFIDTIRKKLFSFFQVDQYIAKVDKWSLPF